MKPRLHTPRCHFCEDHATALHVGGIWACWRCHRKRRKGFEDRARVAAEQRLIRQVVQLYWWKLEAGD